ncbi:MAG: cellulase family glycosylhydrolase, partial [Candidatus Omnitrophota bacterium]
MNANRIDKNITADMGQEQTGISTWRKRNAFFIRCVSITLTLIFLHQQAGWAQNGKPVWKTAAMPYTEGSYPGRLNTLDPKGINIPYDVASTQEAVTTSRGETIIHIQDAHASLSAQYSIVKLLDSLVTNYDLSLIALEGANGFVDTSLLKTFPDKAIRDETAGFLMKEGRMSAGEFFSVTRDADGVGLYGVEDDALYRANLESFKKVAKERAERVENINGLLRQVNALEEKVSSEALRGLNRKSILHRDGSLSFTDYWKHIAELAEKKKVKLPAGRELSKLLESIRLEGSIDFKKANTERRKLIDALSEKSEKDELEELVVKSLAFKENRISQSGFHAYLLEFAGKKGVSTAEHKNLIGFTRYVSVYESVDLFGLYREMEALEERLRDSLYRNADEREIYSIGKTARLLKQLYAMELTNGEYAYLRENRSRFDVPACAEFIRNTSRKYRVPMTAGYDLGKVFGDVDGALDFYRDAEARNNAMLVNTIKKMRAEGKQVAALITGGYHTQGLTELMKEKKLSYLVVTPKFKEGEERPYIAILTNKKKPYEKILETGKYQLAIEAYFQDTENKLEAVTPALAYALGRAAIEGADMKAISGMWIQTYENRYNALVSAKGLEAMAGKVTPEEFRDFLLGNDEKGISPGIVAEKVSNDLSVIACRTPDGLCHLTVARNGKLENSTELQMERFHEDKKRENVEETRRNSVLGILERHNVPEEYHEALMRFTRIRLVAVLPVLKKYGVSPEEYEGILEADHIAANLEWHLTALNDLDEALTRENIDKIVAEVEREDKEREGAEKLTDDEKTPQEEKDRPSGRWGWVTKVLKWLGVLVVIAMAFSGCGLITGPSTGEVLVSREVGVNWGGIYGQNFGITPWFPRGNGISHHAVEYGNDLEEMISFTIGSVRIGLVDDGRSLLDEYGNVVAYNDVFQTDVEACLGIAYEKYKEYIDETGNGVVEFFILDFLVADTPREVNGVHLFGRDELFTDEATQDAFMNDFLIPFLKEYGNHAAIGSFDIINEPEWITTATKAEVRRFIEKCAAAVREHAPGKLVTVGVNTEHAFEFTDIVDYVAIHHYEDRFGDNYETLEEVINDLNAQGIPWAIEEYATGARDVEDRSPLEWHSFVEENGGKWSMAWNWNAGRDDRTWATDEERNSSLEELAQVVRPVLKAIFGFFIGIFTVASKRAASIRKTLRVRLKGMLARISGIGSSFFRHPLRFLLPIILVIMMALASCDLNIYQGPTPWVEEEQSGLLYEDSYLPWTTYYSEDVHDQESGEDIYAGTLMVFEEYAFDDNETPDDDSDDCGRVVAIISRKEKTTRVFKYVDKVSEGNYTETKYVYDKRHEEPFHSTAPNGGQLELSPDEQIVETIVHYEEADGERYVVKDGVEYRFYDNEDPEHPKKQGPIRKETYLMNVTDADGNVTVTGTVRLHGYGEQCAVSGEQYDESYDAPSDTEEVTRPGKIVETYNPDGELIKTTTYEFLEGPPEGWMLLRETIEVETVFGEDTVAAGTVMLHRLERFYDSGTPDDVSDDYGRVFKIVNLDGSCSILRDFFTGTDQAQFQDDYDSGRVPIRIRTIEYEWYDPETPDDDSDDYSRVIKVVNPDGSCSILRDF